MIIFIKVIIFDLENIKYNKFGTNNLVYTNLMIFKIDYSTNVTFDDNLKPISGSDILSKIFLSHLRIISLFFQIIKDSKILSINKKCK